MAKTNKPVVEEGQQTTPEPEERKISLDTFLDIQKCNRAEKTRYMRLYGNPYQELTIKEWTKVTGLTRI